MKKNREDEREDGRQDKTRSRAQEKTKRDRDERIYIFWFEDLQTGQLN